MKRRIKRTVIIAIVSILALMVMSSVFMAAVTSVMAGVSHSSKKYDLGSLMDGLPSVLTEEMVLAAIETQERYRVPAALTLAQIVLESSGNYPGGLSQLAYECKNLFGIKGEGPSGYKEYKTSEQKKDGTSYTVTTKFRKYNSFAESIEDHAKLLVSGRYVSYTAKAKTDDEWAKAITNAGYATDTGYADKLISIMKIYNLYKFDGLTLSSLKAATVVGDGIADGQFIWPVPNLKKITSGVGPRWGSTHKGIDISGSGALGSPIYAADGGTVTYAGRLGTYGNVVYIDHGNGYETRYAHQINGGIMVVVGQKVSKGQQIGRVGSTGRSTGPHLHFEIRYKGVIKDPEKFVSPP